MNESLKDARILIVDDNQVNIDVLYNPNNDRIIVERLSFIPHCEYSFTLLSFNNILVIIG